MQPHANVVTASSDGCGEAKAIRCAVSKETKVKSGRPLQQVFIDLTGPYPPSSGGARCCMLVVDNNQRRMAAVSAVQERYHLMPRLSRLEQSRQTLGGDLWRFGHCSF